LQFKRPSGSSAPSTTDCNKNPEENTSRAPGTPIALSSVGLSLDFSRLAPANPDVDKRFHELAQPRLVLFGEE